MRCRSRGFTLIELMVVVALGAILAALATPSFKGFISGQRVKTAASDFLMTANFARSEAIKRNVAVTISAASGGVAGWKDGWSVFAGTTQLSKQDAYAGLTFSGPASAITYLASGRLGAAVLPMAITGADGSTRCIAFDLSGLPRSTLSSTGTCS